jgi:hypothetical protein
VTALKTAFDRGMEDKTPTALPNIRTVCGWFFLPVTALKTAFDRGMEDKTPIRAPKHPFSPCHGQKLLSRMARE